MNAVLVPCSTCRRHVRVTESTCPFCAASLRLEVWTEKAPIVPRRRLGSLAVMAFRATALGAVIAACGGKTEEPADAADGVPEAAAGASGRGSGGSRGEEPPPGSGGRSGSGGSPGTGGMIGPGLPPDGGPVPIYRATPRG